ncbi:unnamed protein product (macronuclear) [Paramecium tetraurelia]|uniref:Protein kinase domain-containing protein n=1 Tax=Paramecium tetraurelia TaxID=5888 RepID=A0DWE5_PARTE|nr:uncharacterized protein GSPATT00021004001 [Paramecium tetraurelia]CAK87362.1 unnamed protein product [Paramecium tetraurelia]|eukprot:XP_001454759.1 hypothetical protein (macronuclear) [Paramecium tetraurelia strain d4-2]
MDLSLQLSQMKLIKGNDFRKNLVDNGHLGQGNSRVYSVIVNGKKYALKQVIINQCNIENEIKIMQQLSPSEYVINLIDFMILETVSADKYAQSQQFAYLLMEKGQQNLDSYIKIRKHFIDTEELHKILEQLINIFEHLQQKNIAHRDIKLENLLIMEPFQIKACDVGCSTQIETIQTISVVGTKSYLAPELLNAETSKLKHNPFKSDVYSLGLCFLYLVTLQQWHSRQKINSQIEEEIITDYMRHVQRITESDQIILTILKKMLQINPNERPDFIELKAILQQLKENQSYQQQVLSKGTTIESFESPKKAISQFDYLSPDVISSRGRNTGSNYYQQERQKSAKQIQLNLSNQKKQKSSTNLLVDTNKKRQASRSPNRSSPSHFQTKETQFSSKPPSGNPLKLPQSTKARQIKTPSSPSHSSQNLQQRQQWQQSKFYHSVVESKRMHPESFSQTMPSIQMLGPDDFKPTDDLLNCSYSEVAVLYQNQSYISLYQNNQNHHQTKCQLPNKCKTLILKLNNQTPELVLSLQNDIQILTLELIEDSNHNTNYKWSDNLSNMQFPCITQLDIIVYNKSSQVNNIIQFLTKVQHIPKVSMTIGTEMPEQDHRTIMWKLSKYNCTAFEFKIPRIKLNYTQTQQLWQFNQSSLEELSLDYEDCGLQQAFSLLVASLRTLDLKKFQFNLTKLQSKNSEVSLFLEYLGSKQSLKDLVLILDYMTNYDKLVQEKLKNNIGKLKNLERLTLSLIGNTINYDFFERLFTQFEQLTFLKYIVLSFDRIFEKEKIKQLQKKFQFLSQFTIQFYGTNTTLTIIMHNNGLQKLQDYGITKCNQGKQIKLSKMYYCIKCSKTHSFFLNHLFQICSTCVTQCHSKCENAINSYETVTHGSDSMVQSQILLNEIRKNHTFIESFNSNDHRCYCHLLGTCNQSIPNRDRNKNQIQFNCKTCKKSLCRLCSYDCHQQHQTKELYINKFVCQCECDKHV